MRFSLTNRRNFRPLVAVLLLSLVGCGSESDPVVEETFERLYTIQPTADITIQNRDGAILIYGSNTNEMRVQATKKAYSQMRLKQIAIDVSAQPTSVSINVKRPPNPTWALFDRSGTVDCTIVIPATANVSLLHLDAGEVLVDGMHGQSVHAWLGDGRMLVHNCFTDSELALRHGNLTISYDWWGPRTFAIKADIGRGNAWAFLPGNAAFHLVAETAHGRVASDFDDAPVARAGSAAAEKIETPVNGGGQAAIKVRTANGDVKIVEANP
ncbi:MAG TPA: hypothetical protein VFA61_11865 [Candidatus Udaeobacter sp.]|nr:hypothetical protein [Candidatus Udaeobacter sp.]